MQFKVEFPVSSTKAKLKEIVKTVCATLNSSSDAGGKLIIFSEDRPYSDKDVDDVTRKIEQALAAVFGDLSARYRFDKIPPANNDEVYEMHYQITPTASLPSSLYTIAYNMFYTSNTQIHQVPSNEPLERVMEFIKGEQKRDKKHVLGEHRKDFFQGKRIALEETKEVQLKLLKDESSKKSDLATRLTNASNKLAQYVSGFANGSGGHIYCGIHLNEEGFYVVQGQTVPDQKEIICKVENTIDKLLVWPGTKNCLKRGEDWEIYFEEVSNSDESIEEVSVTKEPKYVIVITVNSHDKGVFVKEPESYHVVKGMIRPLTFAEWGEKFRLTDYRYVLPDEKLASLTIPAEEELPADTKSPAKKEKLTRVPGRCKWSSPEALKKHIEVLKELLLLRNNGKEEEFDNCKKRLSEETSDEYHLINKCLIQQQEAGNLFRKKLLVKADEILKENETFLNEIQSKCDDVQIYQIRRLYWMGVVKRAQKEYAKCRELCEVALQASQHQPNILVVSWIHYNKAKLLEIDIAKLGDATNKCGLRNKCLQYYESALRCSFALGDFPENIVADLLRRVLISMARVSLGAFFDGEHVVRTTCSRDDIKRADELFNVLNNCKVQKGWCKTKLSKAEYQLARAERFYRSWEESSAPQSEQQSERQSEPTFIKKALKKFKKALRIAEEKNFVDVSVFAQGQIKILKKLE